MLAIHVFAASTVLMLTACASDNSTRRSLAARVPGHLLLGGLFPVHTKSASSAAAACGLVQPERGIQRLEAMLYTIDVINNDSSILPHVTLGASIFDTCSRDTYALEQSLEYVRASMTSLTAIDAVYRCGDGSVPEAQQAPAAVAGVIGGSYSTVSIQVANLLRLFRIPQISYASTSAALSDKQRFDYFARTVPPDNLQAKAMADIVRHFNWTYVSTVASNGDYGENGIESFKFEAKSRNICMAVTAKVPPKSSQEHFEQIIRDLLSKPATVVVLFLRVEDAANLLRAATRLQATRFVWIASDGWGTEQAPVENNDATAEGALTLELSSPTLPGFSQYFNALRPATNTRNPWFGEYWQFIHDCSFDDEVAGGRRCSGHETLSTTQESKLHFVSDAVYVMARALHNYIEDVCARHKQLAGRKRCARTVALDGERLFNSYIIGKSFSSKCHLTASNNMNPRRNREVNLNTNISLLLCDET